MPSAMAWSNVAGSPAALTASDAHVVVNLHRDTG